MRGIREMVHSATDVILTLNSVKGKNLINHGVIRPFAPLRVTRWAIFRMPFMKFSVFHILLFLILLFPSIVMPQDGKEPFFMKEDFDTLDNWKPLYFPKIKKHTSYTIAADDHERYLKAESAASASALIYKKEFNVYDYRNMRWRWRAENVYEKGDSGTKAGDDYPLRIYITFKYDPKKAGRLEKLRYEAAKLIYGEYPPHSALNYVWANKETTERIITSPYTSKTKIIIIEKGTIRVGSWEAKEADILKDYKDAFGEDPPSQASIAIMNDSDNTGEGSVSYIDYIEIHK